MSNIDLENNVGSITFDANDNIIAYSGVGQDRIADVKEFSVLTIEEDNCIVVAVRHTDLKAYLYKKDGVILAVYVSTKSETQSTDNN